MGSLSRDIPLPDEAATSALGARLAAVCRPGDVITLRGGLGAGKSTLARALIRTLAGAAIEVPSPTFTLVQTYETAGFDVWHVDLYRIERSAEIGELGLDAAVDGLLIVEWPERMGARTPRLRLEVELCFVDSGESDGRIARMEDLHDWARRLPDLWR